MARVPGKDAIYDAAARWKEQCLITDGSVLGGGVLWTAAHLDELDEHFVRNADASSDTFEAKLRRQLGAATPGARRLAAELLWVMLLFPMDAGPAKKRSLVTEVWGWSGEALDPRQPLTTEPFDADGIGRAGTAYNTGRWREMAFLVALARALKAGASGVRRATLGDPWRASEWISSIPESRQRQLRHMLLHVLFPDSFEPVASTGHRQRLLQTFAPQTAGAPGGADWSADERTREDQQLLNVRRALEQESPGVFVNFYVSPWRERWDPRDDGGPAPARPAAVRERPARVWVIAAGEGARLWPELRDRRLVAIGWDALGDLRAYPDRDAMQRRIRELYPSGQEPVMSSLACWQFSREMALGDEVFVKQGRDRVLAHGVITGDYLYDASRSEYPNVRGARWDAVGAWTVPSDAQVASKTLTEITTYAGMLAQWRSVVAGPAPREPSPGPEPVPPPYTVADALAEGVFLSRDEFGRLVAALRRRKNVILQGAPGVGKSFVARRLAYALVGSRRPDRVQCVQFHQSYAYEDFVQGWRPSEGGFARRDGVFHEFCRRAARAAPDEPHVFVIDEINRGNLSKIFGELLLLLEHDKRGPDHAIPLTYAASAADTFYVPENVHVIGLMNTADRSLAMVDYALRRRFAFITLEPAFGSPAFADLLDRQGLGPNIVRQVVERVGEVNRRIAEDVKNLGRGFEIGHSYFCPAGPIADGAAWYDAVIEDEIRPLLEEYWFDDPRQVESCLAVLRG